MNEALRREVVITGFERSCEKSPGRTALIYLGERFTYRRLRDLILRFAAALAHLGVRPHERVMIYVPNSPQFLIAYLGAQKIGAVPVPVSPIYTPYEVRYLLKDAGAETIVCTDTNFGYVREVFPESGLKRVIVTNLADLLPWHKRLVGAFFDKVPRGKVERGAEIFLFRTLLRRFPPEPPPVEIDADRHLAYILYTGGTTGFPKGCISTHTGMVSFIREIEATGDGFVRDGEDVFIMVNPLFHQMAQGMLLGMVLSRGNTAVIMPVPQVDAVLEAIQRHRVSLFLGAPMLYRMILENDRLPLYDLSSLRYCWSGGDVLPAEVSNRWRDRFGLPIYQVYGATEVGFVAMSPLDSPPVPGSVGRPLPSRAIRIVNPDTLKDVAEDTPGELLVTSPHIQKEYWNNPGETAASYVELDGRVWYRMKDFIRKDPRGMLFYMDRAADVIKHKGYRVSCSEIESVLQDHSAVMGACVIGVPDAMAGERIKAIVVLKSDARGVGASELAAWCRDRLAAYKVPGYIEFRDMLPKSKVGKLLRREIREEERRRVEKGEKKIRI
jgi:long-chain acyl-CoA synthetase